MAKAGICAISDDGRTVQNSNLKRKGMKKAKSLNIPVLFTVKTNRFCRAVL